MTEKDVLSEVLGAMPVMPTPPAIPMMMPGIKNKIQFPALLPGMPVPPAIPALPGMEKIPAPPGVKVLDEKGEAIMVGPELPKIPTPPGMPAIPGMPVPEELPKEKLGEEEVAALLEAKEPGIPSELEAEILERGDGVVLAAEGGLPEEELEL